eukprot:gnl/Ergobibamus_cyprinoides/294.p1 GENE.gnl/Ergobibamus_cyprinoides/294~~gnl/Ergobibamus_cyprinoides/294.p1  ORF type:complete len:227 (+),score=30.76 gnl/Ergobibamus_cyprinoides/294:87-767(+)
MHRVYGRFNGRSIMSFPPPSDRHRARMRDNLLHVYETAMDLLPGLHVSISHDSPDLTPLLPSTKWLAAATEAAMWRQFKDASPTVEGDPLFAYHAFYRTLRSAMLARVVGADSLRLQLLSGQLSPAELVRMSTEQLEPSSLHEFRVRAAHRALEQAHDPAEADQTLFVPCHVICRQCKGAGTVGYLPVALSRDDITLFYRCGDCGYRWRHDGPEYDSEAEREAVGI